MNAALYPCRVAHARATPLSHHFTYRTYMWLVDVDDLPGRNWASRLVANFRSKDHLGDPARSIRQNVDAFLALHGRGAPARIMLLTNAAVAGYVFNPISVYWLYDEANMPTGTIVEVHNTYGDRHAYLVDTDSKGRATTDKQMYVSPFNDVSGHYQLALPQPDDRLALTVTLHRDGAAPFAASVRGRRLPATWRAVAMTALRYPLAPLVNALRIRRHGIELWARRLPIVPRPAHTQAGVR